MAKISPVSIKYMIHARFEATGSVEKPDVIGALFGQTEGLLGSDLEIRELQKEGKIGRIEVETESHGVKTSGRIFIPTALDQSETSLIAAAIETIDRVGPTEAKITVERIEDVRGNKREYIVERAKKLLESMQGVQTSREISNDIRTAARADKIQEYGEEKLPAGDLSGEEIIVVEGRADVVNLLENRINNVIGMNGTKLPKDVIELSKGKTIILFLDGDRGGKLIAKNVIENAQVDYIAFAPDGKEVEELNGKEILASLRKRIPAKEFSISSFNGERGKFETISDRIEREKNELLENKQKISENKETEKIDKTKLKEIISEVNGSKKAYILDKNLNVIGITSMTQISRELLGIRNAFALIIDGKANSSVVQSAEKVGVRCIAAKNFSDASAESIEFVSF